MLQRERAITKVVHDHGGVIVAQQNHFGVNGESDAMDDYRYLQGPSPVESPVFNEKPRPMDEGAMQEVAEYWARCCAISREAGFDGVEVHLAHSYLLHEFLTPLFNKRTDEYGGSLENRIRFPVQVIRSVRERVGEDFVVGIRVCVDDLVEGGLRPEDTARIAHEIEQTGLIDYVNTTVATYHGIGSAIPSSDIDEGWTRDKVATVKEAVDLPVFLVGGIKDPQFAEEVLSSGDADMVAMTRAQIAEPEYANKVKEGREDEIIHCIRCNQGCIGRLFEGKPITCILNPATGREQRLGKDTLRPAADPGQWLVVGGGPAGMKSAEVLAKRGHRVTLLERADRLGGQVNYILQTPRRDTFRWIIEDLSNRMDKQGVDVRLNTEADPEMVEDLNPDGVILATGSRPLENGWSSVAPTTETMPGSEQSHVRSGLDVLEDPDTFGERVCLIDNQGDRYASGVAEVLLNQGRSVHMVSRFQSLFPELLTTLDQGFVYKRTMEHGLEYTLNHWVKQIGESEAVVYNMYTGEEQTLGPFDHFVLMTGHESRNGLYEQLEERVRPLHRVGDCKAPRRIGHAIYEGELAGREIFDMEDRYIEAGSLEVPFESTIQGD